jgi:hypothetical protein
MKFRKLTVGVIAGAAALLAGIGSGVVQAAPAHPAILPIQDATAILPIMGAPVTVEVQTGPGGNISNATISPAMTGGTAVVSPNRVTFTSADGSVKVNVKSKGTSQSISARVDSLAKFEGIPGSWTGFVFGDNNATPPGTKDTVEYTITDTHGDGTGDPIVTITDPVTVTDGSTAAIMPSVTKTDEEDGTTAVGRVVFTLNGQSRTLSIGVRVRTFVPEADGSSAVAAPTTPITVASLRITLSGLKGVAQDLSKAAGPQKWTGFLCDGTAASINYVVGADGSLTLDPAVTPSIVPDPSNSNVEGNKIDVRWGDHERVQIKSRVDNGQVTISIKDKIRCKGAPDPTVSGVDTVVPAGNGDHQGDHNGGDHNGGGNQGGKGRGDD